MGMEEIQQMIDYKNKKQWRYFLDDLEYGDYFQLRESIEQKSLQSHHQQMEGLR